MSDGGLGPEATALRFLSNTGSAQGCGMVAFAPTRPVADSRAASAGGKAHESLTDEFSEAN
jgi:hypothetical protein